MYANIYANIYMCKIICMLLPVIRRLVGASRGSVAVRTAGNTLFYTVPFASHTPSGAFASIGNKSIPRSLFPGSNYNYTDAETTIFIHVLYIIS